MTYEIKLNKRYKYAGDIFQKLVDVGLDIEAATDFLNEVEDADVVEVVRCKDCKYFNGKIDVLCERCGDIDEPCGGCHYTGGCTYDDGYCHHGERRKEDG